MKKTKIICSIGPSSESYNVLTEMVKNGMNVVRINFSHATYEDNDRLIRTIRDVRASTDQNLSILYDTKGPDFRCGPMIGDGINLIEGGHIRIVKESIVGSEGGFSVNYPNAIDMLNVGQEILIDDGLLKLEVISQEMDGVTCKVVHGGLLKSRKGIATPGCDLELEFLSDVDKDDIKYACMHDGDFIALSFVQTKQNVLDVRRLLEENGRGDMLVISKIETRQALENLDDIIDVSDGIMVARGDLGVEVPIEKLPIIQKDMIKRCREKEKFVIVATEMLSSMTKSSRPTRAEVTDISNAVLDGADAVMLSGESASGNHPIEAVRFMAKICEETENYDEYASKFTSRVPNDITEAIANAVLTSVKHFDAKAIVVPTTRGHSARVISNLRPRPIILAVCPNERVARRLSINYGVYPAIVDVDHDDMDDVVAACKNIAISKLQLKEKDVVVIAGGIHKGIDVKQTNFMKIEVI